MKQQISIFLILIPALCFGQQQPGQTPQQPAITSTISYAVDTVARDSFFLVETISRKGPADARPEVTISNIPLKSIADFDKILSLLDNQGRQKAQQAQQLKEESDLAVFRLKLLSELKAREPWLGGKPEEKKPAKQPEITTQKK